MWKNEYKSAVEKISATDAWKQQTIAAMQAAQNEQKQIAFPKKKVISLVVAACLCLAVIPAGMMLLQPKGALSMATNNTMVTPRSGEAEAPATATGVADDVLLPEMTQTTQEDTTMEQATVATAALQERTVWQQGEAWPEVFTLVAQNEAGEQSEFSASPMTPQEAEAQLNLAQNETVIGVQLVARFVAKEDASEKEQLVYRFMVQDTTTLQETQKEVIA